MKLLPTYPSFQGAIRPKICIVFHTFVSQVWCFVCFCVLNQRRGLLMFSLPFLFYTFLWGLPCEKGRLLLLEMRQQTWSTVFQKCQAFELDLVLTLFSSQYSSSWDSASWIWPSQTQTSISFRIHRRMLECAGIWVLAYSRVISLGYFCS